MPNNSFFLKVFHPQEDEKAFSLIIKIVMICIILSILLLAIILYSKNLEEESQINVSKDTKPVAEAQQVVTITHDELVSNYKEGMIKVLDDFDGDFSKLKDKILNLDVPMEFQKLHFTLATSLDKVIYENDKQSAKSEITDLIKDNSWLEQGLSKLANNL